MQNDVVSVVSCRAWNRKLIASEAPVLRAQYAEDRSMFSCRPIALRMAIGKPAKLRAGHGATLDRDVLLRVGKEDDQVVAGDAAHSIQTCMGVVGRHGTSRQAHGC